MIARVLTIAGSDSGGGAGIQADLKTFTALKVYGMSVITSVTAQNTQGVADVLDLPGKMVAQQFQAVAEDIGVDAAKTGMLSNSVIVRTVAQQIHRYRIKKLVVDPVMIAKSGDSLLCLEAQEMLIKELLPLAFIVTPNLPEAEMLVRRKIKNSKQLEKAAKEIASMGCRHVLIKGGHGTGNKCRDLFYDGKNFEYFESSRIRTKNTHGTGCTLSAAIAAYLALGFDVFSAVQKAKDYTTGAITHSFKLGQGHGPLNHFWNLK